MNNKIKAILKGLANKEKDMNRSSLTIIAALVTLLLGISPALASNDTMKSSQPMVKHLEIKGNLAFCISDKK